MLLDFCLSIFPRIVTIIDSFKGSHIYRRYGIFLPIILMVCCIIEYIADWVFAMELTTNDLEFDVAINSRYAFMIMLGFNMPFTLFGLFVIFVTYVSPNRNFLLASPHKTRLLCNIIGMCLIVFKSIPVAVILYTLSKTGQQMEQLGVDIKGTPLYGLINETIFSTAAKWCLLLDMIAFLKRMLDDILFVGLREYLRKRNPTYRDEDEDFNEGWAWFYFLASMIVFGLCFIPFIVIQSLLLTAAFNPCSDTAKFVAPFNCNTKPGLV